MAHLLEVGVASGLVVALLGDGAHGTAPDTDGAVLFREEATVGVMVAVGARRRRNPEAGDDRPATHGIAERRDEAVAETEGAQPGDIGDMALRSVAGHCGHRPLWQARGGDSRDAGLLERCQQVFT